MGERNQFRVISGGQTGVDRAALDVAIELGLEHGGWCPLGRRAEDGAISSRYNLRETPATDSDERTRWNVRDSDGVLILYVKEMSRDGTRLAKEHAEDLQKPLFLLDLSKPNLHECRIWLKRYQIQKLNIAGARESSQPGIYEKAKSLLVELFTA